MKILDIFKTSELKKRSAAYNRYLKISDKLFRSLTNISEKDKINLIREYDSTLDGIKGIELEIAAKLEQISRAILAPENRNVIDGALTVVKTNIAVFANDQIKRLTDNEGVQDVERDIKSNDVWVMKMQRKSNEIKQALDLIEEIARAP